MPRRQTMRDDPRNGLGGVQLDLDDGLRLECRDRGSCHPAELGLAIFEAVAAAAEASASSAAIRVLATLRSLAWRSLITLRNSAWRSLRPSRPRLSQ